MNKLSLDHVRKRYGLRLEDDPQLSPEDLLRIAVLAEEAGYESIWVPEAGNGRDALTQLTACAMSSSKIKLGTGIVPIFHRTPTAIAMSAASLAAISRSRFILGLGTGHQDSVQNGHGIPFERPLTRMRETIEIVRQLLSGDTVTYHGRVFVTNGANLGELAYSPEVPIYIGALGSRMLELAGELGDGVLLNWTASRYVSRASQQLHRGAAKAGRNPSQIDVAGYVRVAVVEDEEAARNVLQQQIVRYASMPFYRSFFEQCGFEVEIQAMSEALQIGDKDAAARTVSQAMLNEIAVIGSAETCSGEIERRRTLGLQLPVIAPVTIGDAKSSYERTVEAFSV